MSAVAASANKVHSVAPAPAVLQAPVNWRRVDFIADLHLQPGDHANFAAWRDFMRATRADAVFILGDLFEVWVGDDVLDVRGGADSDAGSGFATRCAHVIQAASQRLAVYFMHGNRDFLLGPVYAKACGMTLLEDPTVFAFAGQRWLLSHGDALCLQDTDYMRFRDQVRDARWQQTFLAKPLAERQSIGREIRIQSQARKRRDDVIGAAMSNLDIDLDVEATRKWLQAAEAPTLIHGHTHRPAEHDLGSGLRRIVLSDWDAAASPARACVLRLSAVSEHLTGGGACVLRLSAVSEHLTGGGASVERLSASSA